jgi:hypothetical protein
MERYRHTQVGGVTIAAVGAGVLMCFVLSLTVPQARWVTLLAGGILALALLFFAWLTVVVDDRDLRFWFGPGLIRRSFPIPEIRRCDVVKNSWMYGWGIHLTPRGWLYNVSGLEGVEVELSGGKQFRLGSDEPAELCRAIREAARLGGGP